MASRRQPREGVLGEMAAMLRSAMQNALRRGSKSSLNLNLSKKNFSASAHHDDAYEMAKWEKITYAGIATCSILAIYNLSKGHQHFPDPPPYPYLHVRNKEFPWGPDGLFELKKHDDH